MLNKFQKYLKENKCKIFLKYDGEREKKLYTIRIFQNRDSNMVDSFGGDTDRPKETLFEAIEKLKYSDMLELENSFYEYDKFIELQSILKKKYGVNVTISLLCDYITDSIQYSLYVSQSTPVFELKNKDLNVLIEDVKVSYN